MPRCNVAVVCVVHNERKLGRAIESLIAQRDEVKRIYLVDAGTDDEESQHEFHAACARLANNAIQTNVTRMGHVGAAVARARTFHALRSHRDIQLTTCVDGDDELGAASIAAMRKAYMDARSHVDVIVPREIAYRFDSDKHRLDPLLLVIPGPETARPNATAEEVQAWVDLTFVGATFGIRIDALARHNGFSRKRCDDEWVRMFCGWARRGARFAYSDVHAQVSYQYWQHDLVADAHADRRRLHQQRRFVTARQALVKAA